MARCKRSSRSSKMEKSQSSKKQSRPVLDKDEQMKDPTILVVETSRSSSIKQVWKEKRPCHTFQGSNGLPTAFVRTNPMLTTEHNYILRFQCADRLAEWVFQSAKCQPMLLNLRCEEQSKEVRNALLRQFHRWPEPKISCAVEQYRKKSEEAKDCCQNQVQLYIKELRGKLLHGAKSLFWLDVLQPMLHPEPVERHDVREVLLLLLEELKCVEGVYEQLAEKNERVWDLLKLPVKLEPLFQGVSTLTLSGHKTAAKEAMQLLAIFAGQNAARIYYKSAAPTGLSIVASVGLLAPIPSARELPDAFCQQFSQPFITLIDDWCLVVDQVLGILEKSLQRKWLSCEQASFKKVLQNTIEHDLQSEFARLRHALATDELDVLQTANRVRSSTDVECLDVSISRGGGLLVVQFNGGDQFM